MRNPATVVISFLAAALPCCVLAYAVATGTPYAIGSPEPTFALIGVSELHEYVIDYNLSADDCRRAEYADDMRFSSLYCEAESKAG